MNLCERNKQLFKNETAIELTGQTLEPLYNICNCYFYNSVTSKPEDGWSDNPNYCYKYNALCQPCSSL